MSLEFAYFHEAGPGPFSCDGNELCPFCEDENKIPVVINNNLTNEIKKIPFNIFQDDAELITKQIADLLDDGDDDNSVLRKIYSNHMYKDASRCSLDTFVKSQQAGDVDVPHKLFNDTIPTTIPNKDTLNKLNSRFNTVDPSPGSNFMKLMQQTNEPYLYDIEQELGLNEAETSSRVGQMIQSIVEDYRQKCKPCEPEDECKMPDFSVNDREARAICRQREPMLKEVNFVIFGSSQANLPKEGSDDYYKLAQEYALFRITPGSACDLGSSKDDDSPAKASVQTQNFNTPPRSPAKADLKVTDDKRPNFEDPAIISEDVHYPIAAHRQQQSQQHPQQPPGALFPTFEAPHLYVAGCSTQPNYVNTNAASSHSINPYQMPASFLAYNTLNQKLNPRLNTKLATPQMFLSPHQYLMQASQASTYPTAPNFAQAMVQPPPNYANLQPTTPFYNASFKETHINTAFIQQHQYQQYNVLSAAAAGNYEMLVYEQMLHQTQKIKTVIARNRLDKRLQLEMQKNATKMNPNMLPSNSAQGSVLSLKDCENIASQNAALKSFISQIGSNAGTVLPSMTEKKQWSKGLSDMGVVDEPDDKLNYLNCDETAENVDFSCKQLEEGNITD